MPTRLATMFALKALLKKRLLESDEHYERDGDSYYGYKLTESGWDWMLANQNKFAMRKLPRPAPSPGYGGRRAPPSIAPKTESTGFDHMDDDIPF